MDFLETSPPGDGGLSQRLLPTGRGYAGMMEHSKVNAGSKADCEHRESRCEAVARRGCRERVSECAKRRAFEFQGALELGGSGSRASGRASELARAEAASVTGRGCRGPGALGAPRTLASESRVRMRVSGGAFDGQAGLGSTTSGRRSPEAPLRQHWRWRGRRTRTSRSAKRRGVKWFQRVNCAAWREVTQCPAAWCKACRGERQARAKRGVTLAPCQ